MGKIKKILENELIGGTQGTDVYPVTSTKAVYNEDNENLDSILKRRGIINVSTNYNSTHIAETLTLEQAIDKVPLRDRVLGFTMTFLSSDGWKNYQFIGTTIDNWVNINNWTSFVNDAQLKSNQDSIVEKLNTKVNTSDFKDIHPFLYKDSFIIADLDGNVAFEVDKSGKTKISNVDKKPTTNSDNLVTSCGVKEAIDEAVNSVSTKDIYPDLYEDSLCVSDSDGNIAFKVDKNGQTKYVGKVYDIYDDFNQDKFIIADKNGFVVAKINNTGASFAFKNPMNFLERKVFYTLGDSLSAANKYQLKLAEITGATFDAEANIDATKPISVGGTTTMGANDISGFQRARNLVSSAGNKDVVIIENINDMNDVSYGGNIDSAPYTEYPDGTNNGATKTLYGAYKWLCEYLITNLPSTHLFWMIPNRIYINYSSPEMRSDGTINMDYYTSTQAHKQYMQLVAIQKEVAAYYGIPVLDMIVESGMNYINGGTFFYDNNVHPKDIGYYRWGETIARLLTSK